MSWWRQKIGGFFSSTVLSKISALLRGRSAVDEETIVSLRALLIEADLGLSLTNRALEAIQNSQKEPLEALKAFLLSVISGETLQLDQPLNVVLMVGVNGVGKTTSIAKLAHFYKDHRVMVASGDTYRAAAEDQLRYWSEKTGAMFVEAGDTKDPAAVMYDALQQAKAQQATLLIVDTAGRMHGNQNLMDQLKKIKRVCAKIDEQIIPKVLLVLDGSLGQSNLAQAKVFLDDVNVDGLVLTKIDGSSKGGSVFQVCDQLQLPVCFLGVGESLEDLLVFEPESFIEKVLK